MTDKKLYNIYGKEQLKERLENENFSRITCSFYNYHSIKNLESTRDTLYDDLDALNILGRIYIADEGINAQFNIPDYNWDAFLLLNNKYPFLKNINIKKAVQEGISFLKLKVLIKDEIVAWGISKQEYDMNKTGQHLNAAEFNNLITEEDTLLIDMRNSYESEVGKFENAIIPDIDRSEDLLPEIKKLLKGQEENKILMYCTGGIRCEKASSFLIKQGFNDVNQLDGGIIKYANDIKKDGVESKFIGKNFVFDSRLGEKITDDIISSCHQCNNASNDHTNCENSDCHILFIQCDTCRKKYLGCCSNKCLGFIKLNDDEKKDLISKNIIFNGTNSDRLRPKLRDLASD